MLDRIRAQIKERLAGSEDVRLVTLTYSCATTDLIRIQADFYALRRRVSKLQDSKATSIFFRICAERGMHL
jgi:hypothetical protein